MSTSVLERTKRRRERDLKRVTELLTVCTCAYPLQKVRSLSGHTSACPASEAFERHRQEDEELRDLIK
jgi:hypothetical protein